MKKTLLFFSLMMLSIVAMAQRPGLNDYHFYFNNGALMERLPLTLDTEIDFQHTPLPGISIRQGGIERILPVETPFGLRLLQLVPDEYLRKADELNVNTYVVKNKRTGESVTRAYVSKWSEWRKTADFLEFSLEDADADGGTKGMLWGHVPFKLLDEIVFFNKEQFVGTPGGKVGFELFEGDQVMGDFACFSDESGMTTMGNLKPLSRIMMRMMRLFPHIHAHLPAKVNKEYSEEYTGEYEILFYFEFQNQVWNNETNQMELGDEYEVYGKGIMPMHIPSITSFQVRTEDQYVKVGNTTKVKLEQYYEEEAEWNWDDVELVAQYVDYDDRDKDLGFFTWDAATQTLTAVKSNDNKSVSLTFALKSKPNVKSYLTIKVGEGWKYTSFKVGPEEQEVSPGYGCSFYIQDFAPRESEEEAFDNTAIEIDPESDPDDNFRYYDWNNNYSARLDVYRTTVPPGEYTLRFRLKSDHSIGSTMKIKIVGESE